MLELQMSGVEVAVTVAETRVSQVVSCVIEPILAPHAEPVRKYPVVPAGTTGTGRTPLLYGNVCPNVFAQPIPVPAE